MADYFSKIKNRIEVFIEKRMPLVLSVLLALIAYFFTDLKLNSICNLKEMLSAVINIAAVIIGFLLTTVSILISLTGKKVIKRIQMNNATSILTLYFASPIVLGFCLIILSTVLIPFDNMDGTWSHILATVLLFNAVYFILTTIRISLLLLNVLRSMSAETDTTAESTKPKPYVPDPDNSFKR